jgi:hypothetical protein
MLFEVDKSQAVAYLVEYLDADGQPYASVYDTVDAARHGIALLEAAGGHVTGKRVERGAAAWAAIGLNLIAYDEKETL